MAVGLANLSPETIQQILDSIPSSSVVPTLLSLSIVCSWFTAPAQAALWRRVVFSKAEDPLLRLARFVESEATKRGGLNTRFLVVEGYGAEEVERVVRACRGVRELVLGALEEEAEGEGRERVGGLLDPTMLESEGLAELTHLSIRHKTIKFRSPSPSKNLTLPFALQALELNFAHNLDNNYGPSLPVSLLPFLLQPSVTYAIFNFHLLSRIVIDSYFSALEPLVSNITDLDLIFKDDQTRQHWSWTNSSEGSHVATTSFKDRVGTFWKSFAKLEALACEIEEVESLSNLPTASLVYLVVVAHTWTKRQEGDDSTTATTRFGEGPFSDVGKGALALGEGLLKWGSLSKLKKLDIELSISDDLEWPAGFGEVEGICRGRGIELVWNGSAGPHGVGLELAENEKEGPREGIVGLDGQAPAGAQQTGEQGGEGDRGQQ